jgi:hypothetical protein
MKNMKVLIAVFVFCILTVLTWCGGGNEAKPDSGAAQPSREASITVTFTNYTDYNFQELYVSPTAANEWGADHLGSTSILKKNGSFDIKLPEYDFDNFDILVVDEDDDEYLFERVTMQNGAEVQITFDGELIATTILLNGSASSVAGELNSGSGSATGTSAGGAADYSGAGHYSFAIYNLSDYDVYAIYMGPRNASIEDVDILPSILPANGDTAVDGYVNGAENNNEWTLYIEDTDGDVSASYEVFNPWTIRYVDIYWNTNSAGWDCDFYY